MNIYHASHTNLNTKFLSLRDTHPLEKWNQHRGVHKKTSFHPFSINNTHGGCRMSKWSEFGSRNYSADMPNKHTSLATIVTVAVIYWPCFRISNTLKVKVILSIIIFNNLHHIRRCQVSVGRNSCLKHTIWIQKLTFCILLIAKKHTFVIGPFVHSKRQQRKQLWTLRSLADLRVWTWSLTWKFMIGMYFIIHV